MRVVHLSTFERFGGAAVAAGRLHRALLGAGVGSTVLVGASEFQEKRAKTDVVRLVENSRLANVTAYARFVAERLYFLPYERDASVRFQFSPAVTGVDLEYNALIRQADVIHLHWINFGFLSIEGLATLLRLGKPVVWTMHDMWPFTGGCHHSHDCEHFQQQCGRCPMLRLPSPRDLSHRVWTRKQRAFSVGNVAPVACSQWLAGRASRSSLFRDVAVRSIPNPLDTTQFSPTLKADARRALGLPTDKRLLLFAAAKVTAEGKGFSYFRDALTTLFATLPEPETVELLIFGGGDRAAVGALPFRSHHLGHLSDVAKIALAYSAADAFVIPSLAENLPNTIMEAQACGTPSVGFAVGGIPEMIRHKENGYVARYKDAADLAEGLRWLLSLQHDAYETLCQNARQHALDHYAEDVIAAQYVALYQELLGKA